MHAPHKLDLESRYYQTRRYPNDHSRKPAPIRPIAAIVFAQEPQFEAQLYWYLVLRTHPSTLKSTGCMMPLFKFSVPTIQFKRLAHPLVHFPIQRLHTFC